MGKLMRKGWVEKIDTLEGVKVKLTDGGRKQVLQYKLNDLKPRTGEWDGKWRVVFFDIPEKDKKRRDGLRKYLGKLGFRQYQRSVFICPYNCEKEVQYLREVLEIPHGVKGGILDRGG